jgi:hypothetical protein
MILESNKKRYQKNRKRMKTVSVVKKEWRDLTKTLPKDMIIYQLYHIESAS